MHCGTDIEEEKAIATATTVHATILRAFAMNCDIEIHATENIFRVKTIFFEVISVWHPSTLALYRAFNMKPPRKQTSAEPES